MFRFALLCFVLFDCSGLCCLVLWSDPFGVFKVVLCCYGLFCADCPGICRFVLRVVMSCFDLF